MTPPSKFRFESLLKIRESVRLEKKDEFLAAQHRLQQERDELARVEREIDVEREETKTARAAGTLDANSLRRRQTYRKALAERRDAALARIETASQEAETRRAELNEAIKETKILQKLKEKQENERREFERKRAEKDADEIATRQKIFETQKERSAEDDAERFRDFP